MRADFFGKCAEYADLAAKIQENLLTVTPMSRQELEQAITAPAKQVNLTVEPELVEQIIDDMGDSPGILPLLQYTLTEIWQQRTGEGKLTLATYSRLGGVKGTLQKRATEVYEGLSGEEQEAAKRIFLELTQLGEGTEDTRRRVLLGDLTGENREKVIQKLADARLIVTQEETKENQKFVVVDVAHEALIRHWLLLRKWLDDNRDRLREKRKIEVAAEEWRSFNKRKDYLLRGGQLKKAKAWQKREGGKLGLPPLAGEFIKVSEKNRKRELLLTAGWLTIPIFVVFLAVAPHLRQQRYDAALEKIKNPKQAGTKEALELLSEGCWIKWMPENFITASLFGKCHDLSFAKLSSANLRSADLSSADLSSAKLVGANFINAELVGADLSIANLINAKLIGAKLIHAKLMNANLSSAELVGANLSSAELMGANLINANLSSANLSSAKLMGANLSSADLFSADLFNTNLSSANLSSADLSSANLSSADLKKAIYTKETKLPKNFDPSKNEMLLIAPGVNLSGADLSFIDFGSADFQGINLTNANLESSLLGNVKNLTPEQVKAAKNWEKAIYDEDFNKKLGLK
ncbi:pentapeptide repeat-containing protein [Calothrix sp. NIES-4101]|nr:pentapeptide repeat-containing protein [Calothrix sp. NIES-4101]